MLLFSYSSFFLSIAEEEAEDEILADDTTEQPQYNKLTMPEVVISLDASDEFLKQRVMNLPQSVVEGTHNTEEGGFLSSFTNIPFTCISMVPLYVYVCMAECETTN